MTEDEKNKNSEERPKLCSNCAYRKFCKKRFSVNTVNGQVQCVDYAPDLNAPEGGSENDD